MDHHSLSPVPLSDRTAKTTTMATDMSDLTDLAELASAADAMDVTGSGDSADAEGTTDTSDTPNDALTAASPSSDAAVDTPGSPLPGSSVRRRPTSTSTSTSSRPRTRAGTGRPLKINYPKKRVSVACDVCRARKTRCDARRPACSFCAQLGIDCVYRRGGSSNSTGNNGTGSVAGSTASTPKGDSLSKTDIVARLGRLESLLREKESSVSSPSFVPVPVPASVSASVTSPLKDAGPPTGDSPVVQPPLIPSSVVSFSVVSPYAGGHSP